MKPEQTNTIHLIKGHLESVAEELRSQASQAMGLMNPTAVGTEREEIYRRFLERHLPKMCDVFPGGYVFDLKGNRSKQTDIIVTAGSTPRFQLAGNTFIAPLEGTIAVVEVKSKLDKNTLTQAMDNIASIPKMPDSKDIYPPFLSFDQEEWEDMPYKIIFAFDGIERDSIQKHFTSLLKKHKNRPVSRTPNIIHVLGKYTIRKI